MSDKIQQATGRTFKTTQMSSAELKIRSMHPRQCQWCYKYVLNHMTPYEKLRNRGIGSGNCYAGQFQKHEDGHCPSFQKELTERGY